MRPGISYIYAAIADQRKSGEITKSIMRNVHIKRAAKIIPSLAARSAESKGVGLVSGRSPCRYQSLE